MPVRRAADPQSVQQVWDAIRSAAQQKQTADLSRLAKFIQKAAGCTLTQAELYVKQTFQDGLIIEVKKIAQKGSNVGNEVESYRINGKIDDLQTQPPDDGHDWYCIECHLAGDVSCCERCFRVFHPECSTNARQKQSDLFPKKNHQSDSVMEEQRVQDFVYNENLCSICNIDESDPDRGLEVEEFNYLLGFILLRIKSWLPEMLTNTISADSSYTVQEQRWRGLQLFYHHMDMASVDLKIRTKEYKKFAEFQSDVYTMMHNIAIFHGVDSEEHGAAQYMIRDMKYDISELQNCVDCYKHSNEKINNKWFCLPCRKPHKLVWAKQKGYPYWPAKVIRETDNACDVRFFGGKYERSILPMNCIKPITTTIAQLHIKRTGMFNRSVEELHFHQKLLDNPAEVTKLLQNTSPSKRKSVKTPRKSISQPNTSISSPRVLETDNSSDVNEIVEDESDVNDVYRFREEPVEPKAVEKKAKDESPSVSISKRRSSDTLTLSEVFSPPKVRKKSTSSTPPKQESPVKEPRELQDVIHISDVEDDRDGFQVMQESCRLSDSGLEQVTSSTELDQDSFNMREGPESVMQKLDQPYSDAVEKMRRKLESCKDKSQLITIAMNCMQAETDRLSNDHNDTLKRLFEAHNAQISETKKKQWCFNCEQDAIYHCCWNTAYCSPTCQQQHWQAEHKKVCRRKR